MILFIATKIAANFFIILLMFKKKNIETKNKLPSSTELNDIIP